MGEMSYFQWLRRAPSLEHCASALPSLWWPGDFVSPDWSSSWESLSPGLLPSWAGLLFSAEKTFSSSPASPGAEKFEWKNSYIQI